MVREILGALAVTLAIAGFAAYGRGLLAGKTRPHVFTWLVWAFTASIAFVGQLAGNGGAGAWSTGVTATFCCMVLVAAVLKGSYDIKFLDWVSLGIAVIAAVAWFVTNDLKLSVALAVFIDAIAYAPTIRKSVWHPEQEVLASYGLDAVKHFVAFWALRNWTFNTVLYPTVLVVMNLSVVLVLVVRRTQLQRQLPSKTDPEAISAEAPSLL